MNEEKVKKYSKDGMICCGIITIISIVGFIFITIFDRNISDIAVFGVIFVLLIVTCVYGFVKFYKQFNNPNNKKVNNNAKTYRGYLYNSEWNWDIAEANYRIQYNKKDTDLNEKDEEIIWKYCCTEIAFYLAWLVENEFLTFIQSNDQFQIDETFNPHKGKVRELERVSGKIMGGSVSFPISEIEHSVFYNPETRELKIQGIPDDLHKKILNAKGS